MQSEISSQLVELGNRNFGVRPTSMATYTVAFLPFSLVCIQLYVSVILFFKLLERSCLALLVTKFRIWLELARNWAAVVWTVKTCLMSRPHSLRKERMVSDLP